MVANWKVGASRNLPLATDDTWDGSAAEASIFAWAGGDEFDPAKARRGFLVYDAEEPKLKGSYKLPFAMVVDGSLKASPAGVRAAASRLPQSDIGDAESKARSVIDAYESRMNAGKAAHDDEADDDDDDSEDEHEGDQEEQDRNAEEEDEDHRPGKAAPWRKVCGVITKAGEPDNYAIDLINRHALRHLDATDVFAGRMKLANTKLDRSFEKFPKSYLDRFAETLPGKSVMPGHDYSQLPIGRFYDAEVRPNEDGDGHHLLASYYMPADHAAVKSVQHGVIKDVSIGFVPDKRICDLCMKDYDGWQTFAHGDTKADGEMDEEPCQHIAGREYDGKVATVTYGGDLSKVEALEGSFVWLGCQHGAQTAMSCPAPYQGKAQWVKSVSRTSGKGDTHMDDKEKSAALSKQRQLQKEIDRLTPLADDGTKYRDWLKSEIGRLYRSLGEEKAGTALLKALEDADAESLESVRDEVDKRHAAAFARGTAQMDADAPPSAAPGTRSVNDILFPRLRREL